jgi:PIN domain nuclease of toxin-antitoxin system
VRARIDSHTLIWAVDDPDKLSPTARATLQDPANELLVSAATIWEIAIKVALGKLTLSRPYRDWMNQALADLGTAVLPITVEYADAQAWLPDHDRDPFDRLLIAQGLGGRTGYRECGCCSRSLWRDLSLVEGALCLSP